MSTIQQFKIRPDGFKEIRKALLIRALPISLLALLCGYFISSLRMQFDLDVYLFLIPLSLGALTWGVIKGINRQKVIFDSYQLTFDSIGIKREQYNTPTVFISYADINEINKNANGSFIIQGKSPIDFIAVPPQIEDCEKLENLLAEFGTITTKTNVPFLQRFRLLLSVLVMGLMTAVFVSFNKYVVGICGVLFLSLFIHSFFEVQRSKNIDNKTKRTMWWSLLVMISIIATMYIKLIML